MPINLDHISYPPFLEPGFDFPSFYLIEQTFPRPRLADPGRAAAQVLSAKLKASGIEPGMSVAVGVGSRGLASLADLVSAVCRALRDYGAEPFIVPTMGSHGGGKAEGQLAVLAKLGISPSSTGCEIKPDMAARQIGTALGEVPVFFSETALQADKSIIINRVKPHTKFKAAIESGLVKMLAIGLGKHLGALSFHRWAYKYGFGQTLREMGRVMLDPGGPGNLALGLGVVENAYDEVMAMEAVPAERILDREPELLALAKANFPTLPVKELDALVVARAGKDISGAGMDANVMGRALDHMEEGFSEVLRVIRLALLDLTEASQGNATGLGNADFITRRVFEKLDYSKTMINCLTAGSARKTAIPAILQTDEMALQACLTTIGPVEPKDARVIIIRDTLSLSKFLISEGLVDELKKKPGIKIKEKLGVPLDGAGRLEVEW